MYCSKNRKNMKESLKTHRNRVPRGSGVLKSKSTRNMLPESWFYGERRENAAAKNAASRERCPERMFND